jgi:hypothetical protein
MDQGKANLPGLPGLILYSFQNKRLQPFPRRVTKRHNHCFNFARFQCAPRFAMGYAWNLNEFTYQKPLFSLWAIPAPKCNRRFNL